MTELAKQYGEKAAKSFSNQAVMPVREYAEGKTFLDTLGDVKGKDVLDLACGAGFYSRVIKSAGARRVVGVDFSADMINQARASTPQEMGVEYMVLDASSMPQLGQFDAVTAGFMLNYARDQEQLAGMCQTVARALKPGGRFVGTVPNSKYDASKFERKYGMKVEWPKPMHDGEEYAFSLYVMDPPLQLRCHFWHNETYAAALESAGLSNPRIVTWQISEEGRTKLGSEFWNEWLANPLFTFITAERK